LLTGPNVILSLKVAVAAVSVLLAASLAALARGHYRLHGRLNLAFFLLTLTAVVGFEVVIRVVRPELFAPYKENEALLRALNIHLCFSVPSVFLMGAMLYTGLTRRRGLHLALSALFAVAWVGTFITGIFFLPMNL
jgi:uncharacterized membrane protein YozB (DUF420 family)